ncbi:hypothetical protein CM49_01644 [Paenibacillus sp. P1XP2]|nr:hypothetical protein CM49_01644 [Paenibacillus sp. P1XP2]
MKKFMAGVGLFFGAAVVLSTVYLLAGGLADIVLIVGFSIVIAMLGVMLYDRHRELDARKRAEKRRQMNRSM